MARLMHTFATLDMARGFAEGADYVNDSALQVIEVREYGDGGGAVIVEDEDAADGRDRDVKYHDCNDYPPARRTGKLPVAKFR